MKRTPRSSLKKHDAAEESRATKTRRNRTVTQLRKDKRRDAVQAKRKRVMAHDAADTTGRSIDELTRILAASSTAPAAAGHQEKFQVLKEIRVLLASHENDHDVLEQITESGVRIDFAIFRLSKPNTL